AQTAMYMIVHALTRLLAPVLSYTAEETWGFMAHLESDNTESVFLNDLPVYDTALEYDGEERYNAVFTARDDVMKALELARAAKVIGKSLEAKVVIYGDENSDVIKLFESFDKELNELFIVSNTEISGEAAPETAFKETETGIAVNVTPASGVKCDRCWAYTETPYTDSEGGNLCPRCKGVVC
ncbi:MAG: class I tRNA ligase family protein, partial [Clostridia bacterium]|nr:class I tRNA ligase family protein [Clostridia bacterium]